MVGISCTLTDGTELIQIQHTGRKEGDFCYYSYEHHYNSRSSSVRFIEAEYIRMAGSKILIQRDDCKNPTRARPEQVSAIFHKLPKEF